MPAPTRRSLTLRDAVVLVAATGMSLWLARLRVLPMLTVRLDSAIGEGSIRAVLGALLERLPELNPLLVVYAPTLVFLRLRKPRPSCRRLAVQPGFAACCAIVLVYVTGGCLHTLGQVLSPSYGHPIATKVHSLVWVWNVLYTHQVIAGYAVASVWLMLLLGGRWRPEPSWLDRMGRALGLCFIASVPGMILYSHWLH